MKVKEFYIKQLEDEFEFMMGYEEWLRDNFPEPNINNKTLMEAKSGKHSSNIKDKANIVHKHQSVNNTDYNNPKGA